MTENERDTGARPDAVGPGPEDIVSALRLRQERPRIVRLSRKVLAGGSALALAVICGAILWALQNNQKRETKLDELYSVDHNKIADGLADCPGTTPEFHAKRRRLGRH